MGTGWQPTSFERWEAAVDSSTMPARIVTDAGHAYLKAKNNPRGPHALVREWVGTKLAEWLGLPVFDMAIMEIDENVDEIPLYDNRRAQSGSALVTRAEKGTFWGGGEKQLESVENTETYSGLVIFDTWTRNADRYPPAGSARINPNYDNVFLSEESAPSGRFRLLAIDHTECFLPTSRDLDRKLGNIGNVKDDQLYGLFPEFMKHIEESALRKFATRLENLEKATVDDILGQVPGDWDLDVAASQALRKLVIERAAYVAKNSVDPILEQCQEPQLPLLP